MALSYVFGIKNKKGYIILFAIVGVLFVLLPLVLPIKDIIVNVFCVGVGKYVTIFVQYVIPLSMPLFTFLSNKKTKTNGGKNYAKQKTG